MMRFRDIFEGKAKLTPAVRHHETGKVYRAQPGEASHSNIIDRNRLYKAHDNDELGFGFINHKGHFLDREDAFNYARDNGLISDKYKRFYDYKDVGLASHFLNGANH